MSLASCGARASTFCAVMREHRMKGDQMTVSSSPAATPAAFPGATMALSKVQATPSSRLAAWSEVRLALRARLRPWRRVPRGACRPTTATSSRTTPTVVALVAPHPIRVFHISRPWRRADHGGGATLMSPRRSAFSFAKSPGVLRPKTPRLVASAAPISVSVESARNGFLRVCVAGVANCGTAQGVSPGVTRDHHEYRP